MNEIPDILQSLITAAFPPRSGDPIDNAAIVERMYVLGYPPEQVELIKGNIKSLWYDPTTNEIRYMKLISTL
jgi:hypothetical protein